MTFTLPRLSTPGSRDPGLRVSGLRVLARFTFYAGIVAAAIYLVSVFAQTSAFGAGGTRPTPPAIPSPQHMALLVHSTVQALAHANRTGNYTVIRTLASPGFARANTPERLARIFARLRESGINLAPAVLYDPLLTGRPIIESNGLLRLTGFFPTQPYRIVFDLRFQRIGSEWRIFGLTVQPVGIPRG